MAGFSSEKSSARSGVPTVGIANGMAPAVPSNPNVLRMVYLPNENTGKFKSENDRIGFEIAQDRA